MLKPGVKLDAPKSSTRDATEVWLETMNAKLVRNEVVYMVRDVPMRNEKLRPGKSRTFVEQMVFIENTPEAITKAKSQGCRDVVLEEQIVMAPKTEAGPPVPKTGRRSKKKE